MDSEQISAYASNLFQPSEVMHCSKVITNTTAQLLLNSSQLHSNGDKNVIYVTLVVTVSTGVSLSAMAINLEGTMNYMHKSCFLVHYAYLPHCYLVMCVYTYVCVYSYIAISRYYKHRKSS